MYNIAPKTLFIGRNIIYLPTCHSTNDVALSLLSDDKVFEGTIVITSNQTAGRGQRGNQWVAEAGKNLTFSLIIKPSFLTANEQFHLNIAISLGIHEFLNGILAKEDVKIKWPNDIFYKDRKMGGVLIENTLKKYSIEKSVVGIGLNINQTGFEESRAVSLKMAAGATEDYNLEALLEKLSECLEKYYLQLKAGKMDALKPQYLRHLYWYQELRTFRRQGEVITGQIIGVDAAGRLGVAIDNELCYFNLKEIEFIA